MTRRRDTSCTRDSALPSRARRDFPEGVARNTGPDGEYETGDLASNRLQQEYDQILNGLGREDQNKYIRYTELERELERLFLADPNTEAGRR